MKATIRASGWILGAGLLLTAMGCKSKLESAGDKFLKAGDPINAVMHYDRALQQGKVSREFPGNFAKANIQVMRVRAASDPSNEILDTYKDTLLALMQRHPQPETEADLAQAFVEVGEKRLQSGLSEGAFRFFQAANKLNKSAETGSKIASAKKSYIAEQLKEAESELNSISKDDPSPGIVADYKMSHLALVLGEETPEMTALWSKIREKNLPTYLMYDLEGLVPQVDPRINRYGILIGIVKYSATGGKVAIQAKVWNGTSGPLLLDGNNFRLVDREGNSYDPSAKIGAFQKAVMVSMREESKTGGLSFNIPSGAKPHYLEMKADDGRISRKYLP